jgi:hypothetical protein
MAGPTPTDQPEPRVSKASMTSSKRRQSRLAKEGSEPPLPLCWQQVEMTRREAEKMGVALPPVQGEPVQAGAEIITVYLQYRY